MGGSARLRFATLRAGVEFFDHAPKCAIERRCVVGTRLFSELSAWWFIGTPQSGQIIGLASAISTTLTKGNVLPAVSQRYQTHVTSCAKSSIRPGLLDLQCPNIHVFCRTRANRCGRNPRFVDSAPELLREKDSVRFRRSCRRIVV
jgi:hypothetical protein